jgi:hypothetical protein
VARHPSAETWRKVGIRTGERLVLLHAPKSWDSANLPDGVHLARRRTTQAVDVVIAFYTRLAVLADEAPSLGEAIESDGMVWVAWPRKAAGHVSDLGDEAVRATLLPFGLVDVKVAALDEDWSGLKFVWRRELRATRPG